MGSTSLYRAPDGTIYDYRPRDSRAGGSLTEGDLVIISIQWTTDVGFTNSTTFITFPTFPTLPDFTNNTLVEDWIRKLSGGPTGDKKQLIDILLVNGPCAFIS